MLKANKLSQNPLRQGNHDACLLSSYGAALFPFTNIPEIKYFVECCDLLGINYLNEGDCISLLRPQLVDHEIGTTRNGSGYDWLEELHNNCSGQSFKKAASVVNIRRGLSKMDIENKLVNEKCTSIFSISFDNIAGAHSICVIYDPHLKYVARDSGRLATNPTVLIDSCSDSLEQLLVNLFGNDVGPRLGESILFTNKTP